MEGFVRDGRVLFVLRNFVKASDCKYVRNLYGRTEFLSKATVHVLMPQRQPVPNKIRLT